MLVDDFSSFHEVLLVAGRSKGLCSFCTPHSDLSEGAFAHFVGRPIQ